MTTFKLNTRQAFLTYPQCPLTPERVLECLSDKLDIQDYIIAQEEHKEKGLHLHVYLKLHKRQRLSREMLMLTDFTGEEEYNGSYERCKCSYAVQKYCKKDGKFITNIEFNLLRAAVDMAVTGDVKAAFQQVMDARPDMILTSGDRVKRNLQMLADDAKEADKEQFTEFINIPVKMAAWNRHKYALWLYGKTKMGKTEYAKSLFNKPLLVRHRDQLKGLTAEHDGIVFDDFGMTHWPREAAIHITDLNNASGIDVKHGVTIIPRRLPRVFCSNVQIWPTDESGAIQRRVFTVRVREMLYAPNEDEPNKPDDDWADVMDVVQDTWTPGKMSYE